MKKLIIALALAAAAAAATAGAPTFTVTEGTGSIVAYAPTNRVLTYPSGRNNSTIDGMLLVCPYTYEARWRDDTCFDKDGKNAWQLLENSLPGFKPTAYEIKYVGNGHKILVVYYSPK